MRALPQVFFQSPQRADGHFVNFGVSLQPTDGPGTYHFAGGAPPAHFYGAVANGNGGGPPPDNSASCWRF